MTPSDQPPVGPAIDLPSTRRSVQRYLLFAGSSAAVGMVIVLFAAGLFLSHVRSFDVQAEGIPLKATITSISIRNLGSGRDPDAKLVVEAPQLGTRSISVGRAVTTFHTGQQVTVLYDADEPARSEVQGVHLPNSIPPLIPLVCGIIVLGFAWPGVRRAQFVRQIMTNDPWDAHRSKLVEVPFDNRFRGRVRTLIRLEGMTGTIVANPVGLRRLNPTFEPTAWVAGFGDQQMVVAPPGGGPVVCVRRVEVEPAGP